MYDTLAERIIIHAEEKPDYPAIIYKENTISYKELAEAAAGIGTILRQKGASKGDRILLSAPSKTETVAIYLGIQYIGATAILLETKIKPDTLDYLISETDPVFFITDRKTGASDKDVTVLSAGALFDEGRKKTDDIAEYQRPQPEDLAELIFTSGTTGKAKGIMLTYGIVSDIMRSVKDELDISGTDRFLIPLPINHAFALDDLRSTLYAGGTVVLQNGFIFAGDIKKNISELHCTAMCAVPASIGILRTQLNEDFGTLLGSLRMIEFGAGNFTLALQREIVQLLPQTVIFNTWGSSETSGALILNVRDDMHRSETVPSIGRPFSGVEVKVLDDSGHEIADSSEENPGRLAIKSGHLMKGYWNMEELTAKTLKDGWIVTGDQVYRDSDGYVFLLGRADDIINVGGEKVSPTEVESVAGEYKGVRESACIGVEDRTGKLGSVPVLFIATSSEDFSTDALREHLGSKLEKYKLPSKIIILPSIPRGRMKKIDRKALRDIWDQREQGGSPEDDPVIRALLTRRSIRRFTERKIDRKLMDLILKTGYYAPSGHNLQTWKFTVIEDEADILELKGAIQEAVKTTKGYFYGYENPATVILVSNDERNLTGCEDASAATENILLAAHALGLGAVWIGVLAQLRDVEPVKSLLDRWEIPGNHVVWGLINLGYPKEAGRLLAKNTGVVHYLSDDGKGSDVGVQ